MGLAILQYNQTDLIQLDMEGMSQVSDYSNTSLVAEIIFMFSLSNRSVSCPTFSFALDRSALLKHTSSSEKLFDSTLNPNEEQLMKITGAPF